MLETSGGSAGFADAAAVNVSTVAGRVIFAQRPRRAVKNLAKSSAEGGIPPLVDLVEGMLENLLVERGA